MSARFESRTCQNCGGQRCVHCNHKGVFFKRLSPRLSEREAAVLRFLRSDSSEGGTERGVGVPERRLV